MSWAGRPKGEFTAHEISLGFELISAHLKNNPPQVRLPLRIVVAGGAVSTLLFRNRKATKDVDFWAPDRETNIVVSEAGREVARRLDYDPFWLNNNMSVFIDTQHTHVGFYERALSQNVTLYESDQIMVYAADWRYQLVQKIVRIETMPKGPVRGAQLSDVVYLAKAIMDREGRREMWRNYVRGWYRYTKDIKDETFEEVNHAYHVLFGTIVFV
ncbi:DUF2204 family protein [Rhizoctonia solani AG-3 Rhs1AP]|uniref:DUF2204 family protein n=2 Tax=Rhizoctonia solani AG-3 TaxID=1086053 RepID=A0A074S9D0_9AGAM|nr:DUF2204 family protein [Rhizoctonia solani AG-3 Rhs1AP]KEP53518.1 DUF2204 family protein [Rhizoctonia solani 123E]